MIHSGAIIGASFSQYVVLGSNMLRDVEPIVPGYRALGGSRSFTYPRHRPDTRLRPYWLGGGGERHNRSACVWSLLFEVETMAVRGCPLGFPWFP